MPITHIFLCLIVALAWGFNFIFVKFSLVELSPYLLCAIRFILASIPAIFFIKKPATSFRIIALYGLLMFALQFVLLFMGMKAGVTPGIASLLMQVQVFFSIIFAAIILGEIPTFWQIGGALVSFSGIALIAAHLQGDITLLGFLLLMGAAATWGLGNLITKKVAHINMIGLVVWGSFVAAFPMCALSLVIDGPNAITQSLKHISLLGGISVLYIVYISTWVGYGVWNWLLSRYPVSAVAPFTLLVPIFGVMSSVLIIGEPLYLWKLIAGLLIVGGLAINIIAARFFVKK